MARKRGGLAGVYDRNKGIFQAAAPALLSFVPGIGIPLAAAAGAAMGGFDRPGKSGIGFDLGGGLKGGLKGAAIGAGAQGARALLTGGGPVASGFSEGGKFSGLLKGARENKDLLALGGKGIMEALPNQANEAAMMNAETQRMLADEQMAEAERERERRRRIAELLMPYAQGVYGSMGSRMSR